MIRRVYIEQLGSWWSLTVDEWRNILYQAVKENGHTLPEDKAIKFQPRCARVFNKTYFCSSNENSRIIQPLDWCQRSYIEELAYLNEQENQP